MSTTEAGRLAAFGKPDSKNLAGVSLQVVIEAARRLDELSCARVVGNIAQAVHAAQKGGQPLGTLTPAAILVLPDGGVSLATGGVLPNYTAPEKLRGSAGDRRSDVFALGVVLWEALAHERLFDGASDDAIKQAVLAQPFRPPSELNANVPAELDAICKKALARDPADRYQSAKVMAAEIDAVLDDAGYPESNEPIAKHVARLVVPAPSPGPATAPAPPPVAPVLSVPSVTSTPSVVPAPSVLPVLHPPSKAVLLPSVVPSSAAVPSAFALRPPAQTAILGSSSPPAEPMPPPSIVEPPLKPVARAATSPAKSAKTEILGSVAGAPPAEKSSLAVTAFLGSNASTPPAPAILTAPTPVPHGVPAAPAAPSVPPPIAPVRYAAPVPFAPTASVAPDFGPPAMPAPLTAPGHAPPVRSSPPTPAPPVRASPPTPAPPARSAPPTPAPPIVPAQAAASDARHPLPAPFKPAAYPQPPNKTSIANAETITTPQLPAHLAVPQASPQLSMPPGMTVPPVSPGAPLQSSDQELEAFDEDEHHADPSEVIALHHAEKAATGSRDVLAGWGWSTGSVQAIDDEDVHQLHDTVRAGRKRLLLAIGGALGVVVIVAVVAFAFSGSKKPADQDERASARSAAVVPTSPATTPSAEPGAAPATAPPNPVPEPPKAEPAAPPAPEPTTAEPPKAEPPKAEPTTAEPPKAEPPKAEPPKAEPPKAEPPKAAVVEEPKAEPPKAEPPKAAVAIKAPEPPKAEPPKAEPPKAEPPKAEPPKKLEAKKPPEPKKPPDKAVKRPQPADRVAKATAKATPADKAQPLDPYAAPGDKPKADPAAAYRTGLQQYARGDTTGALATLRTSLSSNPTFAPTWRGLGLVYEKLGNKGQARSAFKRYLQLAPDAGDADQIRDRMERLGS